MDLGSLGDKAKKAFTDNEDKIKEQVHQRGDQFIDEHVSDEGKAEKAKEAVDKSTDTAFDKVSDAFGGANEGGPADAPNREN